MPKRWTLLWTVSFFICWTNLLHFFFISSYLCDHDSLISPQWYSHQCKCFSATLIKMKLLQETEMDLISFFIVLSLQVLNQICNKLRSKKLTFFLCKYFLKHLWKLRNYKISLIKKICSLCKHYCNLLI